ncbi:MAG: class I SAM-dependent methyltransferase [Flavobacteriales bacterium]|nr:class I SAM-dependent methyltransferase [Flavobacteriales bacterium]
MALSRPHFPLIDAVCRALDDIFERRYYADRVIERVLKENPKMGSRDRAFVAETTYNVVRWWRYLYELAGTEAKTDRPSLLRVLSTYFYVFHGEQFTWQENSGMEFKSINRKKEELKQNLAITQSVPDWMFQMGEAELKENWIKELSALNKEADVILRVNTLKTDKEALRHKLAEDGIETIDVAGSIDALQLKQRKNIFRNEWFQNGFFEVQDSGSQQIGEFVNPQPGMRVIDACAGAGGKSLQLGAMMKNKGRLISMDVEERKLIELRKRSSRAGVNIIETKLIDSGKVIKRLADSADRVLLDVPCSGMGTLRRNPDAKWKLNPEFFEKVKALQKEILLNYSQMVKVGGQLIYATCSIFPSENELQVEAFLKEKGSSFRLLEQKSLSPAKSGTDGFFMARLERIA